MNRPSIIVIGKAIFRMWISPHRVKK